MTRRNLRTGFLVANALLLCVAALASLADGARGSPLLLVWAALGVAAVALDLHVRRLAREAADASRVQVYGEPNR